MTPLDYEYLRRFLKERSGLDPQPASRPPIRCELGLNRVPEIVVDDPFLLTRVRNPLVRHFAEVNTVLEQMVKRPPSEGAPAEHPARCQNALLASDAALFEVFSQL